MKLIFFIFIFVFLWFCLLGIDMVQTKHVNNNIRWRFYGVRKRRSNKININKHVFVTYRKSKLIYIFFFFFFSLRLNCLIVVVVYELNEAKNIQSFSINVWQTKWIIHVCKRNRLSWPKLSNAAPTTQWNEESVLHSILN